MFTRAKREMRAQCPLVAFHRPSVPESEASLLPLSRPTPMISSERSMEVTGIGEVVGGEKVRPQFPSRTVAYSDMRDHLRVSLPYFGIEATRPPASLPVVDEKDGTADIHEHFVVQTRRRS